MLKKKGSYEYIPAWVFFICNGWKQPDAKILNTVILNKLSSKAIFKMAE